MSLDELAASIMMRRYRMRFVPEHRIKHVPFAQLRMPVPGVLLRPFWRTGALAGYDHYRFFVKRWRQIPPPSPRPNKRSP